MKILIKVTKEILQRSMMCGVHDSNVSANCAFSLAMRDLFPKAHCEVSFTGIDGYGFNSKYQIQHTSEMTDFILKFDSLNKHPECRLLLCPQDFEVEIPDKVIEYIGIDQVYKILSESKTLELVTI